MTKPILLGLALISLLVPHASAQYPGWQHSGSMYVLTTPEWADPGASASEDGFPSLVWFT